MRRICITGSGFDSLFGVQTSYFHFLQSQLTLVKQAENFCREFDNFLEKNDTYTFKQKVKGLNKITSKVRYKNLRDANFLLLYLIVYKKTYRGWAELEYKLQDIHIHIISLCKKQELVTENISFRLSSDDYLLFLNPNFFIENDSSNISGALIRETYLFRKLFGQYIELVENTFDKIIHANRMKNQLKKELRSLFFMSQTIDESLYKQTEIINFNSSNYFTKYLYTPSHFEELSHRYVVSLRDDNIEEKIFTATALQNTDDTVFSDFEKYTKIIENMHVKRITKIQHIARKVSSIHFYVFNFNKYDYRYFFEVFDHCKLLDSNVTIHFYYQGDIEDKESKKREVSSLISEYCKLNSMLNGPSAIKKLRTEKRIKLHILKPITINIQQEFEKHIIKGSFDLVKKQK